MKTFPLLTISLLFMNLNSCNQTTDGPVVPQPVQTSFMNKFSDAHRTSWSKENEQEWEAEFQLNGQAYSANFSNTGEWLETEYHIGTSDIPSPIQTILENHFKVYQIEASEISETVLGNAYEFIIDIDHQKWEVSIDSEGHLKKHIEN